MTYKINDKHLLYFLLPAYLSGDFALYRLLSKQYNIRPSALKILLFMYVRESLTSGRKSIFYTDLIDKHISEQLYLQSVKSLQSIGLIMYLGTRKGYVMTDKGRECINDYYSFMSVYIDKLESKFNIKTISDNIVMESSSFYSK